MCMSVCLNELVCTMGIQVPAEDVGFPGTRDPGSCDPPDVCMPGPCKNNVCSWLFPELSLRPVGRNIFKTGSYVAQADLELPKYLTS